jgi:4-amino-4-deoxy-L-arabinose transferase-like glycosyltransferase
LTGALLILLATSRFGIGIAPDSVGYLSVAQSIASGAGALTWQGTPLIVQPPLYPLLLALFQRLPGFDPLYATALLNALLFGAALFLAGRIAQKYWGFSPLWTAMFLGTLAVSRPLFQVGVTALSETLFNFWVVLFLAAGLAWRESGLRRHLLVFAAAAAGAVMTRYIGVTVIATGGVAVLLLHRRRALAARGLDLALFGLVAALPFALWILRNHALSGTWMGPRSGSGYTLTQNLVFTGATMLCWYVPLKELQVFALLKKLYLGMAGGAAAGWQGVKSEHIGHM